MFLVSVRVGLMEYFVDWKETLRKFTGADWLNFHWVHSGFVGRQLNDFIVSTGRDYRETHASNNDNTHFNTPQVSSEKLYSYWNLYAITDIWLKYCWYTQKLLKLSGPIGFLFLFLAATTKQRNMFGRKKKSWTSWLTWWKAKKVMEHNTSQTCNFWIDMHDTAGKLVFYKFCP